MLSDKQKDKPKKELFKTKKEVKKSKAALNGMSFCKNCNRKTKHNKEGSKFICTNCGTQK